jgi:hypothetical protein
VSINNKLNMYFLDKFFSYFWPVIVVQCANVTHQDQSIDLHTSSCNLKLKQIREVYILMPNKKKV